MTLSKSQYIRGLQCHKSLWLYKNRPELRDKADIQTESLFNTGYQVGDLAKELFPDGVEVEFDSSDFDGMIQKTKDLIANGTEVIYEATFKENGIFAMVDILVKNGDVWDIYEVKASTSIKEYHLNDASIQWHALGKILPLGKAYIVHINNSYIRDKELNIYQLFSTENVTEEVLNRQESIEPNLHSISQMLKEDEPDIDIGHHCIEPFGCDFMQYCRKHIPEYSVFDISYAMGKQWKLYYQGILKIEDIPDEFTFGANASMQIEHFKSNTTHTDKEKIEGFLNTIEYPINFFDFETFANSIPRFSGQRPYVQMPFQYSLHILHKDGRLEHKEFLGDENRDPRESLAKQMLKDISPKGSIIAYNQSFEKGKIKDLAQFLPELSKELLALNKRFVDLAHPFQYKHYYHPNFRGKYSIKVVLPTLFPDAPELSYKNLEIQEGGTASDTYANLHLLRDKTKREQIRQNLLDYCHLDTLAMVKIYEFLKDLNTGE